MTSDEIEAIDDHMHPEKGARGAAWVIGCILVGLVILLVVLK